MKVYGIGGLGADERVFSELRLDFEFIPISWITPQDREPLSDYALRFSHQIDQSVPFSIIGVSFGGILALELSKIIKPEKTIIISSAASRKDIPAAFRFIGKTGILNILPAALLKPPPFVARWFFGVNNSKHQTVLNSIISETEPSFLKWAVGEIVRWDSKEIPNALSRIHGSSDRLLHYSQKEEDVEVIENGGHFMIMDRAKDVSKILNRTLAVN
ncbi:MAG: alpha/beta hydrolase [Cyclobacteriaceae bacterium]